MPYLADLLEEIQPKTHWKSMVKQAVIKEATEYIENEALTKSTLEFLNPAFQFNKCHNVIRFVRNPREVRRACIKTQMVTGTYMLQSTRHKFNQVKDDTCLLCGEEPEDLVHCLLQCPATDTARKKHMPRVLDTVPHILYNLATVLHNPRLLTQLLIDCTHPRITELIDLTPATIEALERASRNYCYAVHTERCKFMLVDSHTKPSS